MRMNVKNLANRLVQSKLMNMLLPFSLIPLQESICKNYWGSYPHIICGIWIPDPVASNVSLMVKLLDSPSGGPYDLLGNLRVSLDYRSETFPFFFFFSLVSHSLFYDFSLSDIKLPFHDFSFYFLDTVKKPPGVSAPDSGNFFNISLPVYSLLLPSKHITISWMWSLYHLVLLLNDTG